MATKKKPVSLAKASVQTEGLNLSVWSALKAIERGDRAPLIQFWQDYRDKPIPSDLHHFILRLIVEHTPLKKKVGRPNLTTRWHDPATRIMLAQRVLWLVEEGQPVEEARRQVAALYVLGVGESLLKRYCLNYNRMMRR